jgi:hypothetical protein
MKKILAVALAISLVGCAQTKWGHPSNNEYDFNRDRAQCNLEANAANPNTASPYNPYLNPMQQANVSAYNSGANIGRAMGFQNHFNNCMMAKGYYQGQ